MDTDSRAGLTEQDQRDLLAQARDESLRSMRARTSLGQSVSDQVVWLSRAASAAVAIGYFAFLDTQASMIALSLALPMAVAWLPNAVASATGRLSIMRVVRRPSAPRPLLALAWAMLLFPIWIVPIRRLFGG